MPWRAVAINEEESTLVESWSGYALERSDLFLSAIVIPLRVSEKELNVAPARGSIRFWLAPHWSTANEKSGGTGPGHLAHLLELVNLDGKAAEARWTLFLNEPGDTVYFVGQTQLGLTEILKAPVEFTAGDWRMITLCYSETNSAILLDNQIIATGEGVVAPASWEEKDLGLVVGSDVLASSESLAEAQFEELTTMRQWPRKSDWQGLYFKGTNWASRWAPWWIVDWQGLYFRGTKWRSLLGALGTKEEEQTKIAVLKAAGLLPEDYGLAKSSGEGDGPIVAYSYAEGSLWLEITGVTNGLAALIVHGTTEDVAYEILSKESLTNSEWAGEQVILGAGGQDWTPTTVAVGTRTNQLFLWARSWADTDGDGLPDWWEMEHGLDPNNPDTGNTGVSDGYKDGDNDGWNNLQEYQNGTSPSQFNTPAAPQGFTVLYQLSSGVVEFNWQAVLGPVTNYSIQFYNPDIGDYETFNLSPVSTSYTNYFAPTNLNVEYLPPVYWIQAHYSGGDSDWSEGVSLLDSTAVPHAVLVRGPQGGSYLAVSALPENTTSLLLSRVDTYVPAGNPHLITNFTIWVTNLVNGTFLLPASWTTPLLPGGGGPYRYYNWYVQTVSADGHFSDATSLWGSGRTIPYFDGRAQLKQNLIFLLRAATPEVSFGYSYHEPSYAPYFIGNPTNYAYAGFFEMDDSWGMPRAEVHEFRPFDEHYRYRNFVFDLAQTGSSGHLQTSLHWESFWDLVLEYPATNQFRYPTNVVTFPTLLGASDTRWLYWSEFFPKYDGPWDVIGITYQAPDFIMAGGAQNIFGLSYLSAKLAWGNALGNTATLVPGGSVNGANGGYFYPETTQPGFQTVNYLFAPVRDYGLSDVPLPGNEGFLNTNTTPLLITSVGDGFFQLAGYAKLAITNGYAGVYGYLGQYFDKAYKTTNGVVTTNETGILSPYGEFFPTEPGLTALVTMPDLDTGERGTATVHVVKLQLDVNHDGVMDLRFAGPDNTSPSRPFHFWINDDWDRNEKDSDPGNSDRKHDYVYPVISSKRDLEDFARLWVTGQPPLLASNGYVVTLSWANVTGNPAIRLYRSCETNGGIGYLSDTNIAAQQAAYSSFYMTNSGYGAALDDLPIGAGNPFVFPANFFASGTNNYLLICGAGVGKGELVLTISQNETNVFAQTSLWLDLHDVKDFYERAVITNSVIGAISNMTSGVHTLQYATASALGDDQDIIVLVHGINVSDTAWRISSETVFKRLYWSGFHGKFATVKWPCNYLTPPSPVTFDVFNLSEAKAYKASQAFTNYLNQLRTRFPDDRLHLLVHSQGNAVASEAIMRSGVPADTYILTQGAIAASAYDVNAPIYQPFVDKEVGLGITPEWQPLGYRGIYTNLTGRIVNFYNAQDGVLAIWKIDQTDAKPSVYYHYDGTNCLYTDFFFNTRLVSDPQEARAMVSRSRTLSIGQSGPASGHGVIQSAVDLNAQYGFNSDMSEHSAQWNRPIQTSRPYFQQVLTSCQIQPAP